MRVIDKRDEEEMSDDEWEATGKLQIFFSFINH